MSLFSWARKSRHVLAFAESLWMRGLRGFRGHAGAGVGSNGVRTRRRCQSSGTMSGVADMAASRANSRVVQSWLGCKRIPANGTAASTPPPPPPSNPPSNNPLILFSYPTQAAGTDVSGLEISIRAVAAEFKAYRPSGPTVAGTDVSRLRISRIGPILLSH